VPAAAAAGIYDMTVSNGIGCEDTLVNAVIVPDVGTDPNNCGACGIQCDDGDPCTAPDQCVSGVCTKPPLCSALPPNVSSTGCNAGGQCYIVECEFPWADQDYQYANGCECQVDSYDQSGDGNICGTGALGALPDDGSSSIMVSGNIVPMISDRDWFFLRLEDANDAMRTRITLTYPDPSLEMGIALGGCGGSGTGPCQTYTIEGTPGVDDTQDIVIDLWKPFGGEPICSDYTILIQSETPTGVPGVNCVN
jgi:hypothetical protein